MVITMNVNYNTEKINEVLYNFYNSTGITIDLLKSDFTKISHTKYEFNEYCKSIQSTAKGKKCCRESELTLLKKCASTKQTQMHICHAGLVDMSVPVIYNDEIIGFIVFGQLRSEIDFSKIKNYISNFSLNVDKMENFYGRIPFYDSDKIQSVSSIAIMLVKYILLENMLKPYIDDSTQKAVDYISENLENDISIKEISKAVNMSKSVLYKKFHSGFNCTVSEYINKKRIEKSIEYLMSTDLSMEEISQKTGFSNSSYYSKIFKKIMGISPLKYKKLNR